jgi:hypothetical protein
MNVAKRSRHWVVCCPACTEKSWPIGMTTVTITRVAWQGPSRAELRENGCDSVATAMVQVSFRCQTRPAV